MSKITLKNILAKKKRGAKNTVLTAYDYPFASIFDRAGVDIILVGDSLSNVVLGLSSTREVNMNEMIHHAKAVRRAVKRAFLVGDMPFDAYQKNPSLAVKNAKRFINEAGCDAVKVEWFSHCLEVVKEIKKAKIPVMGHVGLTPQTADKLGGMKVQGTDAQSAKKIMNQAKALEKAGCFSVVLECIPAEIAKVITQNLKIPTIGIGAGKFCDGQVLVAHDMLGFESSYHPKFVKKYTNLDLIISKAVQKYCADVVSGKFPNRSQSFAMPTQERKNSQ